MKKRSGLKGNSWQLFALLLIFAGGCALFEKTPEKYIYTYTEAVDITASGKFRAQAERKLNLVHTRLDLRVDWANAALKGTAELKLSPHFYETNIAEIDANGLIINNLWLKDSVGTKPLVYEHDGRTIKIELPKSYQRSETFTIRIEYAARPFEVEEDILKENYFQKGLYFINHDKSNPYKPRQLWTQGQPQSASFWFPTIDAPNQRTTQEMYLTVEQRYTTLTNGTFMYSMDNPDGSRTDHWVKDTPHPPYLFAIAIGEYAVVEDSWRDKDVFYYVEPEYEKYAKDIFGITPEMISFYSELFQYDYPWDKYHQAIVRDFVAGAMENTGAVLFFERAQRSKTELLDRDFEYIIAHELIHHWFGNLVTCASWSHLALNEAFATFGVYWWEKHHKGQDKASLYAYQALQTYLREAEDKRVPIVRFYYDHPRDLFDRHTYQKGARVLYMLQNKLGDEAFFEGVNRLLTERAGQTAEMQHLRMAFEAVSGIDLYYFFQQWFFEAGHPELEIEHFHLQDEVMVIVRQVQDLEQYPVFHFPAKIRIHDTGSYEDYMIQVNKSIDTFYFNANNQYSIPEFDPDKTILADIRQSFSVDEMYALFTSAENALSRLIVIRNAYNDVQKLSEDSLSNFYMRALRDPFPEIRITALRQLDRKLRSSVALPDIIINELIHNRLEDSVSQVRSLALELLYASGNEDYMGIYKAKIADSSFLVRSRALYAISLLDTAKGLELAELLENSRNIELLNVISGIYSYAAENKGEFYQRLILQSSRSSRMLHYNNYARYLNRHAENYIDEAFSFYERMTEKAIRGYHFREIRGIQSSIQIVLEEFESRLNELEDKMKNRSLSPEELDVYQMQSYRINEISAQYNNLATRLDEVAMKRP